MSNPQEVQKLVQNLARGLKERKVKVAVVGDMILDTAIEGQAGGVHSETNVPILREATAQESIGGAANIALALSRLGVEVVLFGVVGSDLPGRQLLNLLDRQTFADHIVTEAGWPTPRKDWIYEKVGNRATLTRRIDYDRALSSTAREELVGNFRARCPTNVDVVILADHGLGTIGPESMALVGLAKERRAKLVAIPRTTILRGQPVDAIVINAPEMKRLGDGDEAGDPRTLAVRYAREYAQHVFLTLLEDGIYVCPSGSRTAGTQTERYPTEHFQWMGARDMATALIALGMALNFDPVDTGRLANVFRHLVACQRGNGRVLWRDVYQFVGLDDNEG